MPINDATGSITHETHDSFLDVKNSSEALKNIIGSADKAFISGSVKSYGADIASMNTQQLTQFDQAIATYVESIQGIINDLDDRSAVIKPALRGEVATAIQGFFSAVKDLCNKYVESIKQESAFLKEARDSWVTAAGEGGISGDINTDAGKIREQIANIQIDGGEGGTGAGA